MNILITCCLGDHIKSNVEDIRKAYPDCKIVGVDMREMFFNRNGIDVFYKVGRCNDSDYVDDIIRICDEEDIDVILSFSSLDIEPFKKRQNEIKAKIALGIDSMNLTLKANNKHDFARIAIGSGIKIADTRLDLIKDEDALLDFMDKRGLDKVVVKEIDSTGAKGMKIYDYDYIDCHCLSFENPVIAQRYLPGTEYSVDCFCSNGKVLFSAVKVNYEMDLGVSIYSEIVDRKDIEKICEKACNVFMLDGLVGFDLKEDEYGDVFILECNPRPTATISLISRGGVNLLKHLIEYYVDGYTSFEGESLDYGMKIVRFRDDFYFKEDNQWMQ